MILARGSRHSQSVMFAISVTADGTGGIFINETDATSADGLTIGAVGVHTEGGDIDLMVVGDFANAGNTIETFDSGATRDSGDISIAVSGANNNVDLVA